MGKVPRILCLRNTEATYFHSRNFKLVNRLAELSELKQQIKYLQEADAAICISELRGNVKKLCHILRYAVLVETVCSVWSSVCLQMHVLPSEDVPIAQLQGS